MSAFFPEPPHQPEPQPAVEISPDLRDYVAACVRAARPSRSRDEALRLLGEVDDAWEVPQGVFDWDEVEAEARRQGCTVADVIYDRAGRRS
jgi:hypothetical protein